MTISKYDSQSSLYAWVYLGQLGCLTCILVCKEKVKTHRPTVHRQNRQASPT